MSAHDALPNHSVIENAMSQQAMRLRERHRVSRPTSDAATAASDADVAAETIAASSYRKRNLLESHHDCKRCPVLHVESAVTFLMSFNLAGSRRGATSFEAGLRTKFESQHVQKAYASMSLALAHSSFDA